jgi:PAT family beta-lactamase induction signal transducer AmpG
MPVPDPRSRLTRFVWIGLFGFTSGLPFGIFKDFAPVWLREGGMPLATIGWLSALAAPWSIKVLWSPLVDRYGGHRRWIAGSLFAASGAVILLALTGVETGPVLPLLLLGFTLASATQDIAVDAYTIGILHRGEEGPVNGIRVTLYRLALVTAGGLAVALSAPFGWSATLVVLGIVLAGLAALAPLAPQRPQQARALGWRELWRGFVGWFARPGALPLAAFILLYKWPDAALGPMIRTFRVDAGLDAAAIGSLAVPELLATVAGAWCGAAVVARLGVLRGLLVCGLAQALSNLGYAGADLAGGGYGAILAACVTENVCGGLGTTAFLALLMRVCEKERAAVEYALLSALFALTRDLTGAFSGEGVAALGYAGWFVATTLFAVPGLILLWRSRRLAERIGEPTL